MSPSIVERMTLPQAVLWDLDGTLVDSEPYWINAERALVREYGGVWDDELALQLVGNDLMVSAEFLRAHSPITWEPERIVIELLMRVTAQLEQHVPWRPGSRELLQELVQLAVPCALVTMSWRSLADAVLAQLPPHTFAVVLTGDEVTHGKPHPQPYLRAAELLGMPPAQCVAIEDSPTGVRSAVAAGVPTLAVPHVVPVPRMDGSVQRESLHGIRAGDLVSIVSEGH